MKATPISDFAQPGLLKKKKKKTRPGGEADFGKVGEIRFIRLRESDGLLRKSSEQNRHAFFGCDGPTSDQPNKERTKTKQVPQDRI